jgi:hypothetical protein
VPEQIVLLEDHRRFLAQLMNILLAGMLAVHAELTNGDFTIRLASPDNSRSAAASFCPNRWGRE